MKNYAIILASGNATRFGAGSNTLKQFAKVAGKTLLEHVIETFEHAPQIHETIVVITPGYRSAMEEILLRNSYSKVTHVLNGGATRKDSSRIGISVIKDEEANVIIHDGARPLLSQRIIDDCIKALEDYEAVDVAIPSADTIIRVKDGKKLIDSIPEREHLLRGQTPQCFRLSLIRRAHELALNDNCFTDDCGLVIKYQLADVYVVEGDRVNVKITWPEDLSLADKFFQIRTTSGIHHKKESFSHLAGKVIVIFGGNGGIGAYIAEHLKVAGGTPCTFSRSNGYDVACYDDVVRAMAEVQQKHGRIDGVINTAGLLKIGRLADRSIDDLQHELQVNVLGNIHVSKASIPYLRETHGSLTFFTSSSYTRGRALYASYSSSKAAVVNLTQALAEELYAEHIRVNVINPARTATPMRFAAFGEEPEGSLLDPNDVALATLETLASDLTGQVIDVRKEKTE